MSASSTPRAARPGVIAEASPASEPDADTAVGRKRSGRTLESIVDTRAIRDTVGRNSGNPNTRRVAENAISRVFGVEHVTEQGEQLEVPGNPILAVQVDDAVAGHRRELIGFIAVIVLVADGDE